MEDLVLRLLKTLADAVSPTRTIAYASDHRRVGSFRSEIRLEVWATGMWRATNSSDPGRQGFGETPNSAVERLLEALE